MLELVVIVLVIIFYVSITDRMKKLEDRLSEMMNASKGVAVANSHQENAPQQNIIKQEGVGLKSQPAILQQKQTYSAIEDNGGSKAAEKGEAIDVFTDWLADEWPLKVGIFLLILAVGWFVTYAFINDWISEAGRVALGIIFGIIISSLGLYRTAKHQLQGNSLLVLGAISVLISIISGIGLYHLFPASIALVVAFMLVSFMAYVALRQKNDSLGAVTLFLGGIVPMFVFSSVSISIIFLYLFVLTAGILWVTSRTGWNSLNIIALAIVFFYSAAYDNFKGFDDNLQNLIFAFAFICLFYFSNIFTLLFKRTTDAIDLVVGGATGMLFLTWMMLIASKDMRVPLIIFGAFLFAAGSYVIYLVTKAKSPAILYAAVALMLLVSATAIQFHGWELTVAYIMEFSLFIMISLYLRSGEMQKDKFNEAVGAILYVILFLMSLTNILGIFEYLGNKSAVHRYGKVESASVTSDLIVVSLLCIMSFVITVFILQLFSKDKRIENDHLGLARFYGIAGGFYAVILTWVITHLIAENQTIATIISLVFYTVIGVVFYAVGRKSENPFYRMIGGTLFAIVLFRLFFFEFGNMDMVGKIVTFFVVGILFVSTTFIGGRKKDGIIGNS